MTSEDELRHINVLAVLFNDNSKRKRDERKSIRKPQLKQSEINIGAGGVGAEKKKSEDELKKAFLKQLVDMLGLENLNK